MEMTVACSMHSGMSTSHNRLGKHWDILNKWKAKASLKIVTKGKEESDRLKEKRDQTGRSIRRVSRGQQLENFLTCDRLEDCLRNRAANEGSSYEDHLFISSHREKIVKILLRKRICGGRRGFEEWVKGADKEIRAVVKISVTVGRQLIELWKKSVSAIEGVSLVTEFLCWKNL